MADPLLNLTTLTDCPTVVIDGISYPLTTPDGMSVVDFKRLGPLTTRLSVLWNLAEMTADEEAELKGTLNRLAAMLLNAPADVHDRLTDVQRFQIYQVFLRQPQTTVRQFAAQATTATTRKTGASSRRGLPGSTAGPRTNGSRSSPSGSSARVS